MTASLGLSADIVRYLAGANPPEHPVLARCRAETQVMPLARFQISPEQGAFMALLAKLIHARRAFEIGVFTGYSALAVTLAMQERHGRDAFLLACDMDEAWSQQARLYWREAGVDGLIDLNLAPAMETLDRRLQAREEGTYDFGFIDADKSNYDGYYERGLRLLRQGGLMLFDNVLWSGRVADPADRTEDTVALRALAQKIRADSRVDAAMTSVGDGVLLVVKR